ncbi:MAG: DUF502 domain-containing protein [bacterium]|nr:DUF502 domain-containing protein [bacterium]
METPKQSRFDRWLPRTRNVFLAGFLVAIPLAVTYLVFNWLFQTLDGIFQPLIVIILGHPLPGVGLVAIIVVVYILGLFATNVGGRFMLRALDAAMCRAPIIRWVYSPATQVVKAVRSLKEAPFKRVVIVEFPREGMLVLAFVTGKPVDFKGKQKVPVFIPHAPNPMTGFLLLLNPEDLADTELSIEEAMRMVISGGLLSPDVIKQPASS